MPSRFGAAVDAAGAAVVPADAVVPAGAVAGFAAAGLAGLAALF